MEALQSQAAELQNIHCLGEQILASCHPDSIITLKSWISVTKTRYEEVRACTKWQRYIFKKMFLKSNKKGFNWTKSEREVCSSCSGSDVGSAAGSEDPGQSGSTGGREGGNSEAPGLDLVSGGVPHHQRPGTFGRKHRADPGSHRAALGTTFSPLH